MTNGDFCFKLNALLQISMSVKRKHRLLCLKFIIFFPPYSSLKSRRYQKPCCACTSQAQGGVPAVSLHLGCLGSQLTPSAHNFQGLSEVFFSLSGPLGKTLTLFLLALSLL